MANDLEADDVRTGMLFGGFQGADYHVCTLRPDSSDMPVVTVPFLHGRPEFEAFNQWRSGEELPLSTLFFDHRGTVSLTGLHWRGTTGMGPGEFRFDADNVIFGRPREMRNEYIVEEFTSYIDGLDQATHFNSIETNLDDRDEGDPITATIGRLEDISWTVGNTTYRIGVGTPWNFTSGQSFSVKSRVFLQTTIVGGASISTHLQAHWPMRALLVLLYGSPLAWREHRLADDQFPIWGLNDHTFPGRESVRVFTRRTIRDLALPEPKSSALGLPLLYLEQLGADKLKKWIELYSDETIARGIQPSVEVINGMSKFLEPQIMMAVIALDSFGYATRREFRTALWEHILICIESAGIDLSPIGSNELVANALAGINNDLKHPDRNKRPDFLQLSLAVDLALALVRMHVLTLLEVSEELTDSARQHMDIDGVVRLFQKNGVVARDVSGENPQRARFIVDNTRA